MSRETTLDWTQRIGIDLIQAAKNELAFLEEVSRYPNLCSGPFVTDAIKRYEHLWLPLASKHSLRAAPLDIAWVWHVHMLAPDHYQQDCINILGRVLDHSPLDTIRRHEELEKTDRIWRRVYYPSPRGCHINLTRPHEGPTLYTAQNSQIQYNLEEACSRQFKFYYQVSLPHYRDDLFLEKAVEHYEHHLRLSRYHPDAFMVPPYDIDLIWHAHLLHPLDYMQATTELSAKPLPHDDFKTGQAPRSKLYEHEAKPRSVWKAEGLCFARPGAMYRGNPPDPIPPRPKWLYAPLAVAEYPCEIKSIEALHLKEENYIVELEDAQRKAYFSQSFRGNRKTGHPRINMRYFRFEVTKHTMDVCLYKKKPFGKKFITKEELDLRPYFAIPFVEDEPWSCKNPVQFCQRVTVDVPLKRGQYTAQITILIGYPTLVKYSFEFQPEKVFATSSHPSIVLSYPHLMLSPRDLANLFVPCDFSTHPVLDWKGNQVFRCRVVHSSSALLSAVEIVNAYDQVVATAHTVSPGTLPERDDVHDHRNCVFFNQAEGERAMLIRGRKDWAVCIGRWQKASQATDRRESKPQHFVRIKVFKMFNKRRWCLVRKSSGGLFVIKVESDTVVRINLKENKIEISPRTQDIPEVLALALSVSILHLLCIPYNPEPSQESTPAAQTSYIGPISSSFYSAGYLSVKVPTNVFLAERKDGSVTAEAVSEWGCYDFNQDSSCDWNQGSEDACTDTGCGRERVGLDIVGSAGDGGGMGGEDGAAWVPLRPRCS